MLMLLIHVSDDAVYLEDDVKREEYVLNDTGKVFVGNYRQVCAIQQFMAISTLLRVSISSFKAPLYGITHIIDNNDYFCLSIY